MTGKRMTKQKRVIMEVLRGTTSHPTADWVYEQARKVLPDISLGTVYRNLNVLKETGEILELNYGSTFSRYDGNAQNHYHFVCTCCEKVFDVELPLQLDLERTVAVELNCEIGYHRLEFYGRCSTCSKKLSEKCFC